MSDFQKLKGCVNCREDSGFVDCNGDTIKEGASLATCEDLNNLPTGSDVTVSNLLVTGDRVATITIDGVDYDVLVDAATDVSVSDLLTSGTKIGTITIDGVATDIRIPASPEYANVVYIDAATPGAATIFSLESPPTVNDNALKQVEGNVYVATDGKMYVWNGTAYVTAPTSPAQTEWDLFGTSTDAGSNKTGRIQRYADIDVNGIRVGRGNGDVATNTVVGGGGALNSNTTGDNNVALGSYALGSNTTGSSNFGMGFATLGANTTGSFNVGIGRATLRWSLGNYNVGIGMQVLAATGMTGSNNVGIGFLSGSTITTGSNNLCLGGSATVPNGTASNQVSIRNSIFGVGVAGTVANPVGMWGVNQPAPQYTWDINGTARIVTVPTINTATKYLVKDPSTGQVSEQALPITSSSGFGSNGFVKELDNIRVQAIEQGAGLQVSLVSGTATVDMSGMCTYNLNSDATFGSSRAGVALTNALINPFNWTATKFQGNESRVTIHDLTADKVYRVHVMLGPIGGSKHFISIERIGG